jgi:hypothetical protein
MTDAVQVEGLTTLRATLKGAARRVGDMSGPATRTAAFLGARGRTDAPRRTGRLASSVRGKGEGNDAVVESGLAYANRTHWGYARYNQRPQPWLVEGRDDTETTWINNYEGQIETALATVRGVL